MQSARVWNSVLRTSKIKTRPANIIVITILMFSSIFCVMQFPSAITTTTRRNYGGGKNLKLTSLNDMPVPEGDFYAHHAKRQRGHNMVLGIGIASLSFAIYLVTMQSFQSRILIHGGG